MVINILTLLLVFFGLLCFGFRTFLLWKKTGKSGLVFEKGDNAHSFIGRAFGLALLAGYGYVGAVVLIPEFVFESAPLFYLFTAGEITGLILISLATLLCFIAQMNMKDSWRIGIDFKNPGGLVTKGLFNYSRNPIFLTMLMVLFGVFLVLPNWISLFIFLVSYLLIQIQVRLEEEFLSKQYGAEYLKYSASVRRWF